MGEVNQNDMMLNTGIFYHPESISEFQLLSHLVVWTFVGRSIPEHML